jgi:hypothetical protein
MPISAMISTDTVVVEPGSTATLNIEVQNQADAEDRVEVGIEGVDGEWVAIPVPLVELRPNERVTVKVFFNPPRSSESTAGNFPFVARVRSLNDGETRTAQGILTIKAYNHISVDINPKKGFVTATKQQNIFTVSLMNMGNSEHSLQLSADDPEESCTYEFDEDLITLASGQQKDIDFAVTPKRKSPFGSSRLVGYAVTARSTSTPSVVSTAQAQLEVRPFITPASMIVMMIMALLGVIFWLTQPKPPVVSLALLSKSTVYRDSKVTVRWSSENATRVKILAGGELIGENLAPEGMREIEAPLLGTLRIEAVAMRDKRQSDVSSVSVKVIEAPVIPDPKIIKLSPSKTTVQPGEKVTLEYLFKNVVKATIAPLNQTLDLNVNAILIEPSAMGENEYTVVVENSAGKVLKKSFSITMFQPCLAKIIKFDVQPLKVDAIDGRVTMTWQVDGAKRVELDYTGGKTYTLAASGSEDIAVVGKTTFTLKGYDSNGKSVSKSITVTLVKPQPDPRPYVPKEETTGGGDPLRGDPGTTSGPTGTEGTTAGSTTGTTTGTPPPTTGGKSGPPPKTNPKANSK